LFKYCIEYKNTLFEGLYMHNQTKRQFKDALYEQFARVGRALANPHRLELLDLLAQGERTVEDLARESGLSIANASQHLQTLRAAQLVGVRRDGLYAYYRLADLSIFVLWQALRAVGETRLAEIDQLVRSYLHDRGTLAAMSADQLRQQLTTENLVVLDVRPGSEYRAGHIAGARSIPIDELAARLDELPRDRAIVAYCRGPYCVFADEATALLRAHGFNAHRLEVGLPEWRAAGHPVAIDRVTGAP
jgi:rhodanese-related sulfurtransferase